MFDRRGFLQIASASATLIAVGAVPAPMTWQPPDGRIESHNFTHAEWSSPNIVGRTKRH